MSTLRVSGLAYFLHASLGNQLLKLIKASLTIKLFAGHWKRTLFLTKGTKSGTKDLNLEILIWKTTMS